MFYNEVCSIVPYSVTEVIIEKPSCTNSVESVQVFKQINLLSSQSSLHLSDESNVIELLALAVVSDFMQELSFSVPILCTELCGKNMVSFASFDILLTMLVPESFINITTMLYIK